MAKTYSSWKLTDAARKAYPPAGTIQYAFGDKKTATAEEYAAEQAQYAKQMQLTGTTTPPPTGASSSPQQSSSSAGSATAGPPGIRRRARAGRFRLGQ